MKALLPLLLSAVAFTAFASTEPAPAVPGGKEVLTIGWKERFSDRPDRLTGENNDHLLLKKESQNKDTLPLWSMANPPLHTRFYALTGKVRYRNVDGTGYLKLQSRFPGEGEAIIVRTDSEEGPTAAITGRSEWREFWIPVNAEDQEEQPDKLTLSMVFPSVGVVELSPLSLYEFESAEALNAVATPGLPRQSAGDLSSPERRARLAVTLVLVAAALGLLHRRHRRKEAEASGASVAETVENNAGNRESDCLR